jgi:hypothetical protein
VVERRWISGSCAKIVCWQLVTHSNTHVERDPIQYALETDWPVRIRDRADRAYHYVRRKSGSRSCAGVPAGGARSAFSARHDSTEVSGTQIPDAEIRILPPSQPVPSLGAISGSKKLPRHSRAFLRSSRSRKKERAMIATRTKPPAQIAKPFSRDATKYHVGDTRAPGANSAGSESGGFPKLYG